jgi:hypothetical protein
MSDTTPDVEALAYALLSPLGGIHVFAYDAQSPWPFIEEMVALQIDVRASSKKRARDRAYEARRLLLRLPLDVTNRVTHVEVVGGPSFIPDEDGAPRYTIRTVIGAKALSGIV